MEIRKCCEENHKEEKVHWHCWTVFVSTAAANISLHIKQIDFSHLVGSSSYVFHAIVQYLRHDEIFGLGTNWQAEMTSNLRNMSPARWHFLLQCIVFAGETNCKLLEMISVTPHFKSVLATPELTEIGGGYEIITTIIIMNITYRPP